MITLSIILKKSMAMACHGNLENPQEVYNWLGTGYILSSELSSHSSIFLMSADLKVKVYVVLKKCCYLSGAQSFEIKSEP